MQISENISGIFPNILFQDATCTINILISKNYTIHYIRYMVDANKFR